MATSKAITVLAVDDVERRDPIIEKNLQGAAEMMNLIYEVVFDATAPGDSGQTYIGHDHATRGGAPLHRGNNWSEDGGQSPLWSYTPTLATQEMVWEHIGVDDLGRNSTKAYYYCSPGFTGNSYLDGWIFYSAVQSGFEISFQEASGDGLFYAPNDNALTASTFKLPKTGETGQWLSIYPVPFVPGAWNQLSIYARATSIDIDNTPTLKLFSITLSEVPGRTGLPAANPRLDGTVIV